MKNINELVNSQLTRSIKKHDKLSNFVYEMLHLDKNKHNLWIVMKSQQLTILTDNPYLGTQLQYQQQNICTEINRQFLLELKSAKVKIVPPKRVKEVKKEKGFIMGDQASKILSNIASDIKDPELRDSLIKLSKRNE